MIEYSEKIIKILIENNFNYKNIIDLFNQIVKIISPDDSIIINSYKIKRKDRLSKIEKIKNRFSSVGAGCIFTLHSGRRDDSQYIYYTILNENELFRILKLKVFI